MEFRRGKPSRHTRQGIFIKGLKPTEIEALEKYPFIKDPCKDDIFVRMLFNLVDRENKEKSKYKFYLDPTDGAIKDKYRFIDEIRIIPWKCSFCNTKIKSRIEDFSIKNFCCKKCYDRYTDDGKVVSELILNNSVEFTEHCKTLINKDRKQFIKYISKK